MKSFIVLFAFLMTSASFATSDVQSAVYIVVQNVHSEDRFTVEKAPAEFCVGIPTWALAAALTKPVVIQKGYGCGVETVFMENANELTCAKIVADEVMKGEEVVANKVRISVDLSNCGEKKDKKSFQNAVNKAIAQTYKAHKIEIVK